MEPLQNNTTKEITFEDIWFLIRRNLILIIAVLILGAAAGYTISSFCVEKKYSATSYIYTPSSSKDVSINLDALNLSKSLIYDYIEIMKSRPIILSALDTAKKLAAEDGRELSKEYDYSSILSSLSITNPNNTHILLVRITTSDPYDAYYLSNAIADETVIQVPPIMLVKEINKYQEAIVSKNPVSPNNATNAIISGLIAVFVLFIILVFRRILDTTLKNEDDVEKYLGLDTLGTISDKNRSKLRIHKK